MENNTVADVGQPELFVDRKVEVRKKPVYGTILKVLISCALFYWLVRQQSLNLSDIQIFYESLALIVGAAAFWFVGPILLSSLRWKILLSAGGINISWKKAVNLQLIGVFSTTAMPGSLGGDVVKAIYIIKGNPGKSKSFAFWSIIFDRIIGMFGLFFVGAFFMIWNIGSFMESATMMTLFLIVISYIAGFFVLLFMVRYLGVDRKKVEEDARGTFTSRLIKKVLDAILEIRQFSGSGKSVLVAVVLSVVAQGLSFVFFIAICLQLSDSLTLNHFSNIASVFPVGMLVTTLPISPGGLGVGHYAFSELFNMIDLSYGAEAFNAYFISQSLLNITGVISYLAFNKDGK